MRIIKDGTVVDDRWAHVADDRPLSDEGCAIISLSRWLSERADLLGRKDCVGVRVSPEEDFSPLLPYLEKLPLVALDFPEFTDGRSYSRARLLRERFGYRGELRAIGDVLRDQLFYMQRCGFNSFEVRSDKSPEEAVKGLQDFSVCYQPASDSGPRPAHDDQPAFDPRPGSRAQI